MGCTRYGRILRQIRARHREVMRDMAKVLNVPPSFLSSVENGKESVPEGWTERIADNYNLSDMEIKALEMAKKGIIGNNLGDYICNARERAGLTRNALALQAGISYTEIRRIEEGKRKSPSCSNLFAIANVLKVSPYEMYQAAGILTEDKTFVAKAFPALTTEKQRKTIIEIARMITANEDSLTDADLDELVMQVDMFLLYVADRNKRESKKISMQSNGKTIKAEV